MPFNRVHIVINPASGHNEPILNTLNDVFKPHNIAWDVSITQNAGDGARFAREAVASGCDLVMAYGGDGTVLDVANGLIGGDVTLGILPGGTANAMAAEMNIPNKLADAAQLVCDPEAGIRAIDVGKTGDRHFLLRVGSGMVAKLSVAREMKDRFGVGAYLIAGVQALTTPQFVQYRLTIDGKLHKTAGTACLITNGTALGAFGLQLSKKVKIDDGLLDVYVLNNDLPTALGMAAGIAQIEQLEVTLQHWQGREILVEADPPQKLYGDGEEEPFDDTPSQTTLLPGALKVLVSGDVDKPMAEQGESEAESDDG